MKQGITPKPKRRKRTKEEILSGKVIEEQVTEIGPTAIHYVLRNRFYVGEQRHRGEWVAGGHPPFIDVC